MNKLIPAVGCASILAIVACGEQIGLNFRACPCQEGWTCCEGSEMCVPPGGSCIKTFCPEGIDLPRVPIVVESPDGGASADLLDAGPHAKTWPMNAYGTAYLGDSGTQTFSYAESAWPLPGDAGDLGVGLKGFFVEATKGQTFLFKLYTQVTTDAGTKTVTLPLAMYGPIRGVKTGDLCTAPSAGLAQDETIEWTADSDGFYLVAPYHPIVMMGSMPIIEGLGNTAYGNSFLEMSSPGE